MKLSIYRLQQILKAIDNQHVKVGRLASLCTGCLNPQETSLVLISVRGWVNTRTTGQPEGLSQWKIPLIPLGIDSVTIWLVAQCLNLLYHRICPYEAWNTSNACDVYTLLNILAYVSNSFAQIYPVSHSRIKTEGVWNFGLHSEVTWMATWKHFILFSHWNFPT